MLLARTNACRRASASATRGEEAQILPAMPVRRRVEESLATTTKEALLCELFQLASTLHFTVPGGGGFQQPPT
ncbi:hypothetical protein SESBI_05473 [Sesbania bispinosa]|nr:hypothetical protein SESBI_05473 [Sesbania bispinosa]